MTDQVDFYISEQANINAKFLYACRITRKAYNQGLKTFMAMADIESGQKMDRLLWTFSQGSFIPHCLNRETNPEIDSTDLFPEKGSMGNGWLDFPVQLGVAPRWQQGADLIINLTHIIDDKLFNFPRIVELVCAQPEDRQAGRERFRLYREKGFQPNTHKLD